MDEGPIPAGLLSQILASYYAHHTGNPTHCVYFDEIETYNKGPLPRLKVYHYYSSLSVFTEVEMHSI